MKYLPLSFTCMMLAARSAMCQAAGPSGDPAVVIGDSVVVAAKPVGARPSQFEIIGPASYDKAIEMLGGQGIIFKKNRIVAMGFQPDTADASQKDLAVITLSDKGEPVKSVYKVDMKFYLALTGPAVTPQTMTPAITVHNAWADEHRQDGRFYFMLSTTVKSLYVYPAGYAMALTGTDGATITGLSLLTLGGSLYGSYAATKNMALGYGRVEFMNYGADLGGIIYPWLLGGFLSSTSEISASQFAGLGGMIGFPLGILWGSKVNPTGGCGYGNASIMTTMSKFGIMYGFLLPLYFNTTGDEYIAWSTGLSMALIPAGFYIGDKLVQGRDYSSGRSVLITTSSLMGALTGLAVPFLFESPSKEVIITSVIAGHLLGASIGFNYCKDRSYTFGQGLFMAASAVVGTGVVEAFPIMAKNGNSNSYIVAGIAGAWGGLLLGEYMARSLWETGPHDTWNRSSISFPGFYELPLALAFSNIPGRKSNPDAIKKVDLVQVVF